MLVGELTDIGLTENEAKVYVALMQHGSHPISFLAKKADVNRGTAYQALHSLLERGLVAKSIHKRVQIFSPLDPTRIKYFFANQVADIQKRKDEATDLLPALSSLQKDETTKPTVKYYDGLEEVRNIFYDTLTSKDTILLSYMSIDDVNDFLGEKFLYEYTTERIRLGYTLRTIRAETKHSKALLSQEPYSTYFGASEKFRREIRFLDDDMAFPITMYIYDDKVLLLSSKDEHFALMITSKEFSAMQKKIFHHLWEKLSV